MALAPRPRFVPAAACVVLVASAGPAAGQLGELLDLSAETAPAALVKKAKELRHDDPARSAELFDEAFAADPAALADELWSWGVALEGAGRGGEDLPKLAAVPPEAWGGDGFSRVLSRLDGALRDRPAAASAALHALWDERPEVRDLMLDRMDAARFWEDDAFFAAGLDRLAADPPPGPNAALADGRRGYASRQRWLAGLLDAAEAREELGRLEGRVRARLADGPDWPVRRAVLAAVAARRGDAAGAERWAEGLTESFTGEQAGAFSGLLGDSAAAAEVALVAQRRTVAAARAAADARRNGGSGRGGSGVNAYFYFDDRDAFAGPEVRLVALLGRTGRFAEARGLLRDREAAVPEAYDPRDVADGSARMSADDDQRELLALAEGYLSAGLPADAARVARRAAEDRELWKALDSGPYGGDGGFQRQQAERVVSRALEALTPAAAARSVRLSLATEDGADPGPFGPGWHVSDGGEEGDWATRLTGSGLAAAGAGSPVLDALAGPAAADARREARAALAESADHSPAADAARVVLAAADADAPAVAGPLARLAAGADAALAPDAPAPPVDDSAAWFAAGSAAAGLPAFGRTADRLVDAAFEGAGRLPHPAEGTARVAFGVQAGRDALARGDADAAARRWERLGGDLLGRPLPPPGLPDPAGPTGPVDGQRALYALELATFAADGGLADLSMRLVRATLAGGRPRHYPPASAGALLGPSSGDRPRVAYVFNDRGAVAALPTKWNAGGASPAAVAGLLLDLAFPPDRPGELGTAWAGREDLLDRTAAAGLRGELDRRLAALPADGPDAAEANAWRVRVAVRDGDAAAVKKALSALRTGLRPPPAGADGAADRADDRVFDRVFDRAASTAADAAIGVLGDDGSAAAARGAAFATLVEAVAALDAAGAPRGDSAARSLAAERFARARRGEPGGDADEGVRLVLRAVELDMAGYRSSEDQMARHRGMLLADAVTRLAAADLPASAAAAFRTAADRLALDPDRVGGRNPGAAGPPPPLAGDLNRAAAALPAAGRFDTLLAWTFPEPGGIRAAVGARPGFDTPAGEIGYRLSGPDPAGDRPPPSDPIVGLADAAGRPVPPLTGTAAALAAAVSDGDGTRDDARAGALAAALAAADPYAGLPAPGAAWPAGVPGPRRRSADRAAVDAATLALLAGLPLAGADRAAALAAADRLRDAAPTENRSSPAHAEVPHERRAVGDAAAGLLLAWAAGDAESLARAAARAAGPGRVAWAVRPFAAALTGTPIPDPPDRND